MKLQLWTTRDGSADEFLGEVEVEDEEWRDAQSSPGDALQLLQDLASEVG